MKPIAIIAAGLLLSENPDLSPLNKAAVVGVQAEVHQVLDKRCIRQILITDCARPTGHVQPRCQLQAVMLELDLSVFKGHVGAALHVRRAATRIVERLTVHADAHEVEGKRIARLELAGESGDLDPVEIVEGRDLVVHHLRRV